MNTCIHSIDNIKCPICGGHIGNRRRVGPFSYKKNFMILIEDCNKCGYMYPVNGMDSLSDKEFDWVYRWNNRMRKEIEKKKPEFKLLDKKDFEI